MDEVFMGTTRLRYLFNATRITLIAIMDWKLQKQQYGASALPGI
jgi:hypothetical protein